MNNTAIRSFGLIAIFVCFVAKAQEATTPIFSDTPYGKLIFSDGFERNESQEVLDEVGNNWTTSSDRTANNHKQVDLKDGVLHIYIHETANHAVSVRQKMHFTDGAVGLRFRLDHVDDILILNFADLACKEVSSGHLFNVLLRTHQLELHDFKTGVRNMKVMKLLKAKNRTKEEDEELKAKMKVIKKTKVKTIPYDVATQEWHTLVAQTEGPKLTVYIDDKEVGSFTSEGFAHSPKTLLRLLVRRQVIVDDVHIWRMK